MDRHAWDERYRGSELLWTAEPNRFLLAETAGLEPGRALDLACGEGRNAVWLASRGFAVTGVDFSEVALEKAARLAAGRAVEVEWIAADLLAYEPVPRSFDLVVVLYLQLPETELRPVLRRAGAAVAPGGTFFLVAHDRTNLAEGHGGPRDASVLYSAEDVVAELDGFDVIRAERVERDVQTPEGERIALDALLRAVRREP